MKQIYVGVRAATANATGLREAFRSAEEPTHATHGDQYDMTIGPFRTARGAKFMVHYGQNNPHCRTVGEAERLAMHAELKDLPNNKVTPAYGVPAYVPEDPSTNDGFHVCR